MKRVESYEKCGFSGGHNGMSAKEIREHDEIRMKYLKKLEFIAYRIWEHEAKNEAVLINKVKNMVGSVIYEKEEN